ncbi:MAG: phosphoglucomutase/phosphomannomutase family protein [Balneolaceae bacterium]|nr:phosphoglucomutase/phosphomannomutase family protein [Balneolaceae bacterium]
MKPIKFGTDGWRAIIADAFTFENVNIVSQATAKWILDEKIGSNGVVIGYDARFLGREFAEHSAAVFAAMGVPVRISNRIIPTPAISWAAKHFDAVGIVLTASHNPPEYNGFKIKSPFGGSAKPGQVKAVEAKLEEISKTIDTKPYQTYLKAGVIREMNLVEGYLDSIRENIDLDAIRKSGIRVAHDPMFGAGSGLIKELLEKNVFEVNNHRDPLFGGSAPEPIVSKMEKLTRLVVDENCAIGLANDGDADRIGMVDETGKFVSSHQILSLLIEYLHRHKGMNGTIVKTFSTTDMIDKQAKRYSLPVEVTPIGFKYIGELIINGDVLVGGEESGGIAVKGHLPERDGIYIGLLITEMMVKTGKKLSELVQDLFDEYGPHQYYRNDVVTEERKKLAMTAYCRDKKLREIAGKKVEKWDFKDGIKHILDDGSWLLVRQSGTEPVLRIYAEALNLETARNLVEDVTSWVDNPEILIHQNGS